MTLPEAVEATDDRAAATYPGAVSFDRALRAPVMVAAFEGWNDAGDAASAAVEHLSLAWEATEFAELDPEEFYDFQVTRPTINIVEGVARDFIWPTTRITACYLPHAARDVLLVHGIEPSIRWHRYCRALMTIALSADVSLIVTVGALLADNAHTSPFRITGSAHDDVTAQRLGLADSTFDGPSGITGAIQAASVAVGIPTVSLWAAVPHYVADPPSPKATLSLLRALEEAIDIEVPLGSYPELADDWVEQVSSLAAQDEEVSEYIQALQQRDDAESGIQPMSGDTLAEEFQRYLRRRGPKPGNH